MVNSANLGLPFVEAAQSQKHVTVNEGLLRLDALSQLVVQSISETVAPTDATDGTVYAIPNGAEAPWNVANGQLALRTNGGWEYIQPRLGWRAWVSDLGSLLVYGSSGWTPISATGSAGGGLRVVPLVFDQELTAGGVQDTDIAIPALSSVVGVTGRVVAEITGDLGSWSLGVNTSANRYGSGLGKELNSFLKGLTGSPLTYYEDTYLTLTPEGGDFAAGTVRLVIHTLQLDVPAAV